MKNRLSLILIGILFVCSASAQNLSGEKKDALVLYRNGNYREAVQVCEGELKENPNRIESYVVMCWSLVDNKQYAEAEARAMQGLEVSPSDLRLIETLGEAKYFLGKNKEAMAQFEKYVARASESSNRYGQAYYYMGEIFIKQEKYQHADIALTVAVKNEPKLDTWWVRLGYAREMAKNYKEAVNAYDEALRLNSSSVLALRGRERASSKIQ